MTTPKQSDISDSTAEVQSALDRRSFLKRASIISATTVLGLGALLNGFPTETAAEEKTKPLPVKKRDKDILLAAQIAEALAVTTYLNIINTSPFFTRMSATTTAGFDTTKPFTFVPFTPTLPSTLGEFISFIG